MFNLFKNKRIEEMAEPTVIKRELPAIIKNIILWLLQRFNVDDILWELNEKWRDKAIQTKTPVDDWACDVIDIVLDYMFKKTDVPK